MAWRCSGCHESDGYPMVDIESGKSYCYGKCCDGTRKTVRNYALARVTGSVWRPRPKKVDPFPYVMAVVLLLAWGLFIYQACSTRQCNSPLKRLEDYYTADLKQALAALGEKSTAQGDTIEWLSRRTTDKDQQLTKAMGHISDLEKALAEERATSEQRLSMVAKLNQALTHSINPFEACNNRIVQQYGDLTACWVEIENAKTRLTHTVSALIWSSYRIDEADLDRLMRLDLQLHGFTTQQSEAQNIALGATGIQQCQANLTQVEARLETCEKKLAEKEAIFTETKANYANCVAQLVEKEAIVEDLEWACSWRNLDAGVTSIAYCLSMIIKTENELLEATEVMRSWHEPDITDEQKTILQDKLQQQFPSTTEKVPCPLVDTNLDWQPVLTPRSEDIREFYHAWAGWMGPAGINPMIPWDYINRLSYPLPIPGKTDPWIVWLLSLKWKCPDRLIQPDIEQLYQMCLHWPEHEVCPLVRARVDWDAQLWEYAYRGSNDMHDLMGCYEEEEHVSTEFTGVFRGSGEEVHDNLFRLLDEYTGTRREPAPPTLGDSVPRSEYGTPPGSFTVAEYCMDHPDHEACAKEYDSIMWLADPNYPNRPEADGEPSTDFEETNRQIKWLQSIVADVEKRGEEIMLELQNVMTHLYETGALTTDQLSSFCDDYPDQNVCYLVAMNVVLEEALRVLDDAPRSETLTIAVSSSNLAENGEITNSTLDAVTLNVTESELLYSLIQNGSRIGPAVHPVVLESERIYVCPVTHAVLNHTDRYHAACFTGMQCIRLSTEVGTLRFFKYFTDYVSTTDPPRYYFDDFVDPVSHVRFNERDPGVSPLVFHGGQAIFFAKEENKVKFMAQLDRYTL